MDLWWPVKTRHFDFKSCTYYRIFFLTLFVILSDWALCQSQAHYQQLQQQQQQYLTHCSECEADLSLNKSPNIKLQMLKYYDFSKIWVYQRKLLNVEI